MNGFLGGLGQYIGRFNQAFIITIELSILSLLIATIIGIVVGLINTSKSKSLLIKVLKAIGNLYIYILLEEPQCLYKS